MLLQRDGFPDTGAKITILRETIVELVEKLKAASLKDEQSAADDKNPTT